MNALFTNMISQTTGSTKSVSKPSWRQSPIGVILYVLMAGKPAHLKIVATRGRLWRYGSSFLLLVRLIHSRCFLDEFMKSINIDYKLEVVYPSN